MDTKKNVLIFDFDGVIANTYGFLVNRYKAIYPDRTEEDYKNMFKGNVFKEVKHYDEEKSETVHLKNGDVNEVFFRAYYDQIPHFECFKEMPELIRYLSKNFTLVIVSSSMNNLIDDFLDKFGLVHEFDAVYGADIHWNKHKKIEMVFEKHQTDQEHSIMITDTLGDIREATLAGIKSIGVTWGFHGELELKEGEPLAIVHTPEELKKEIQNFFNK